MTVIWLAWVEFARAFTRRAPGGRDFFWIAGLLCLVQLLALIMFSAREGVLERSVDAFLGFKPGYGIPVWTRPNAVGFGGISLISENLIDDIEQDGFRAEPFRRLYNGALVQLPAADIWTAQADRGSESAFSGMTADLAGSLFPTVFDVPEPGPDADLLAMLWPIVLDRDLFGLYFDLEAYRRTVEGRIPAHMFAAIPESRDDLDQMPVIWMDMQSPHGRQLTPFRVIWGRYLGVGSESSAFLVDRRLSVALEAIDVNPALCVDVSGGPRLPVATGQLVSQNTLMMPASDREALQQATEMALAPLAAEFGGSVVATGTRVQWAPESTSTRSNCPPWVPSTTLALHLAATDLSVSSDAEAAGSITVDPEQADLFAIQVARVDGFSVENTGYTAPCDLLSEQILSNSGTRREDTADGCMAHVSATLEGRGYGEMLLFAGERTDIDMLRDFVNCEGATLAASDAEGPGEQLCRNVTAPTGETLVQSRLMLDEVYQDSLQRFGFLTKLLDAVSGPVGLALTLLLVAILRVQIATVVGHRKGDYALMLANGLSPTQLTDMIILQLWMGVFMSMLAALFMFFLLKAGLLWWTAGLSIEFERIMLGRRIDALPLAFDDVVIVLTIVMSLALAFGWWQVKSIGVSRRHSLEDLLR